MHRLTLMQTLVIAALCSAGLVACDSNVEIPTLMPTLAAASVTLDRPATSQLVAPSGSRATTPVMATQVAPAAAATAVSGGSSADIDQALEQFQKDLATIDVTDTVTDSLEISADQALNQFGQSLDDTHTLSALVKSLP